MDITYLADQLLIAMPQLEDKYFSNTVTYICEHTAQGAMGLVINHKTDFTLGLILEQLNISPTSPLINDIPLFRGGPVQPDRGFILHSSEASYESSMKVSDEVKVTTSKDVLEAIANNTGPQKYLIALGYAGWGPGQLEKEMSENIWLSGPSSHSILFDMPVENRSQAAAQLLGVNLGSLSMQAGHA